MKALMLSSDQIDREEWNNFIQKSPQCNIYSLHEYLSTLCPKWRAIIVQSSDEWLAVFPFLLTKKYSIYSILQPKLCQYSGILFKPSVAKVSKTFDFKKKVLKEVIKSIPHNVSRFSINCAPEFDYPLPFHWSKFQLKSKYTYRIKLGSDYEFLRKQYSYDTKREIRKAKDGNIKLRTAVEPEKVIELFLEGVGLKKAGIGQNALDKLIPLVHFMAKENKSKTIIASINNQDVAGAIFFELADVTIYFFGGTAPQYKQSGAMTYILDHAVQDAINRSKVFDFEGSMIESIERFFRGFGAKPVPYLNISKYRFPFNMIYQ